MAMEYASALASRLSIKAPVDVSKFGSELVFPLA